MAECHIPGDSSMYGVGIRAGFYLLWLALVLASWIAEAEIALLKIIALVFSGAAFLALVIRVTAQLEAGGAGPPSVAPSPENGSNAAAPAPGSSRAGEGGYLRAVEVYLVLLLAFGHFFFSVPLHVWHVLTCCRSSCDVAAVGWGRARRRKMKMGWLGRMVKWCLLVAFAVFGMWFWCRGIWDMQPAKVAAEGSADGGDDAANGDDKCDEWGFVVAKVPLRDPAMIAVSIIFYACVLAASAFLLIPAAGVGLLRGWRQDDADISDERKAGLYQLRNLICLLVAAFNILAIELVVEWNHLDTESAVNSLKGVSQTIPLLVSLTLFLRVVCRWLSPGLSPPRSRRSSHRGGRSHKQWRDGARRDSISTAYTYSYAAGSPRQEYPHHRQQSYCHQGHGHGHGRTARDFPTHRNHGKHDIPRPPPVAQGMKDSETMSGGIEAELHDASPNNRRTVPNATSGKSRRPSVAVSAEANVDSENKQN